MLHCKEQNGRLAHVDRLATPSATKGQGSSWQWQLLKGWLGQQIEEMRDLGGGGHVWRLWCLADYLWFPRRESLWKGLWPKWWKGRRIGGSPFAKRDPLRRMEKDGVMMMHWEIRVLWVRGGSPVSVKCGGEDIFKMGNKTVANFNSKSGPIVGGVLPSTKDGRKIEEYCVEIF